jgi:hypothetical protein
MHLIHQFIDTRLAAPAQDHNSIEIPTSWPDNPSPSLDNAGLGEFRASAPNSAALLSSIATPGWPMTERKGWQLAVCLVTLGMSLAGMSLAAQTAPVPNPPSPDLTALQNQLNALTLQQQIITAQNQILAAKVGAPAVTPVQPLAGNITQDDKSFAEATTLAYNAMRADAKRIYDRIETAIASPVHKDKNITLVIYDQASLTGVQQYLAFKPQLALQRESLCFAVTAAKRLPPEFRPQFAPAEAEAGITGATNLVSSVATLLAMFRTDVERRSTEVSIDELTLGEEVANIYKSKRSLPNEGVLYNTRVFVPGQYFMPYEVDQSELNKLFELKASEVFNEKAGGCKRDPPVGFYARMAELAVIHDLAIEVYAQLYAPFQKLTDAENKLKGDQDELQVLKAIEKPTDDQKKKSDELQKKVERDKDALTKAKQAIGENGNDNAIEKKRQQVADLKAALERYNVLVEALGKPDSAGVTPLAKYASSDRLSRYLQLPDTYLLGLKVLKSSASNQTKKNLFLGTRLYFSGACTASFFLIDSATSDVVSSGSFTTVTNYMREKTFKRKFGTEVVQ